MTATNPAAASSVYKIPRVTDVHYVLLAEVEQREVWWDPRYHHTEGIAGTESTAQPGFVRRVGGSMTRFAELPQLIALWELAKAGWITPGEEPRDPDAARRARPVLLTTTGLTALREARDE